MDILSILGGIGLGYIIAKFIDFWLQDKIDRQQHARWLRDNRLRAFAEVTKEFISLGAHAPGQRTSFEMYAAVSQALLLIDDDPLTIRIDTFIRKWGRMSHLVDESSKDNDAQFDKEAKKLFHELQEEARSITDSLRNLVLHDKVKPQERRSLGSDSSAPTEKA
jgi:hypothetical protein